MVLNYELGLLAGNPRVGIVPEPRIGFGVLQVVTVDVVQHALEGGQVERVRQVLSEGDQRRARLQTGSEDVPSVGFHIEGDEWAFRQSALRELIGNVASGHGTLARIGKLC